VKIDGGGFYCGMSQEPFDGINICSLGEEMGCKGMS